MISSDSDEASSSLSSGVSNADLHYVSEDERTHTETRSEEDDTMESSLREFIESSGTSSDSDSEASYRPEEDSSDYGDHVAANGLLKRVHYNPFDV